MSVGEAIAINTVLQSLANVDGVSWEQMAEAGRFLAHKANKVLAAGYTADSFSRALAAGQGLRKSQGPHKRRGAAPR